MGRLIVHSYCTLAITGIGCSLDTRLEDCTTTSAVHRWGTGGFVGTRDEGHIRHGSSLMPRRRLFIPRAYPAIRSGKLGVKRERQSLGELQ